MNTNDLEDYKRRSAERIIEQIDELWALGDHLDKRRLERLLSTELRDIKEHLNAAISALRQTTY